MRFLNAAVRLLLVRISQLAPDALGEGPAAVDGTADPAGSRFIETAVAALGVITHAALFLASGRVSFLVVSGLALVYLVVGVPLVTRLAATSESKATWSEFVIIATLAAIMGDPTPFLAWFPLLVLANLIYRGTEDAIRNVVGMAIAGGVYSGGLVLVSDRLFDAGLARLYLFSTLFMWMCASVVYAMAVGGAVARRHAVTDAALEQRDEAEKRARADAERLRAVLEEAPIGLLMQRSDDSFEYANPPALEMLGMTLEELTSQGTVTVMDEGTRTRVESEIVSARDTGRPFLIEHETIGGSILEVRGRMVDLGDATTTTVTTLRDLTPERDARRHIARLRTLVENSETHMVVWNEDNEVVLANRVFRDLWANGEAVEGRNIVDIIGDQVSLLIDLPHTTTERTLERVADLPGGGTRWVAITLVDFKDPIDDRWLRSVSVRDLTEVAMARRQLEELVVNKDRFIASVSHELRTPLTAVVGLAAELADGTSMLTPEEVQEFAALIAGQSNDVASIVEDLLTMARADSDVLTVYPERIDLERVVGDIVSALPPEVADRVTWTPGEPSEVWADPVRVRQIIRNLVVNAGRHGGPSISIVVDRGRVQVIDDGPPVPEDERDRIFEAYQTIPRTTGRTDSVGLGLAVCRRLSRLMDGDVVYTHDGTHSLFSLILPLTPRAMPAANRTSLPVG